MLEAIQPMYQHCEGMRQIPCRAWVPTSFQGERGVNSGSLLSPTLFGLFLDPLEDFFEGDVDAALT